MSKSQLELMSKSQLDCFPVAKATSNSKTESLVSSVLFSGYPDQAILYSEAVKNFFARITLH